MLIYIPCITLILLFYINFKRKGSIFNVSSILLGIYLLMAVSSIIIYINKEYFYYNNIKLSFEAIFYFTISLILFLTPFIMFNENRIKTIKIPNIAFLDLISILLVTLSFVSIVFFIHPVINALSGDILANRINQVAGDKFVRIGLMNTISGTVATFYPITLLLYFINKALNRKRILNTLLFISSLSYVFFILAYVGRDGALFWILIYLFYYLLFRPYLSERDQIKMKRSFFIIASLLLSIFLFITIARFKSRDYSIFLSLVDYMGQQVKVFNDTYITSFKKAEGNASFGSIREWLGLSDFRSASNSLSEMKSQLLQNEVHSWKFGTFIKEFYIDFGAWGTLTIGMLFQFILFQITAKKNKSYHLSNLIIFILLFQIVYHGVFYFRLYNPVGNLYIIMCILLALSVRLSYSKQNVKILILKKKINQ